MQNDTIPPSTLDQHKLVVVITAYNAADSIAGVLRGKPDYIHEIVVVDDCSDDETQEAVLELQADDKRIHLAINPMNLGVGGEMLRGYMEA